MNYLEPRVRKNIVMVVDGENNEFRGSGFFIDRQYCVTCHHNIWKMSKIKVGKMGKFFDAEWVEECSDRCKDIAFLKIRQSKFLPLITVNKSLPGLKCIIRGYPSGDYDTLTSGKTYNGELSESKNDFRYRSQESFPGKYPWNKKPQTNMKVYQFSFPAGKGLSGSPVCYSADWTVVGMYEAYDDDSGYVIPIELILNKFQLGISLISSSSTFSTGAVIQKGNEYLAKGKHEK